MKRFKNAAILLVVFASGLPVVPTSWSAEVEIPRSTSGDKGRYFLIESARSGIIVRAIVKRLGVDSIVFTEAEINCQTMKMRVTREGDGSGIMSEAQAKWFDLVPGSSKSDQANYLCGR